MPLVLLPDGILCVISCCEAEEEKKQQRAAVATLAEKGARAAAERRAVQALHSALDPLAHEVLSRQLIFFT